MFLLSSSTCFAKSHRKKFLFSKSAAKLLLFLDICKDFCKKVQKNLNFGIFAPMISAKVCTGFSNGLRTKSFRSLDEVDRQERRERKNGLQGLRRSRSRIRELGNVVKTPDYFDELIICPAPYVFCCRPVREWYYNAIRMLLLYFAPLGGGRNLRFSIVLS